jgi:tetratricopeptide (TPR) repeat protein
MISKEIDPVPALSAKFIESWLPELFIFLFVFALFLPCAGNNFINFDDPRYLLLNDSIQHGVTWKTVQWAFSSGYAANWHPLTWLSHALDWQFFGARPRGHHLVNVLLHGVNTFLLYLTLRKMTGNRWRSLFVAALFGMHPLRVESVAWASERKDVLSTLFWMLTLWAYAIWVQKNSGTPVKNRTWYAIALGCFGLGLLSKPMLVTLPFVLLLLDYWPLHRLSDPSAIKRSLAEKIPFFALATVACIVTFFVQKYGGAVNNNQLSLEWGARIANACLSYNRYLIKFFLPADLAVFYPLSPTLHPSQILAALAILILISAGAVMKLPNHPYFLVGWLWYLGTAVPVIGLIQVGTQSMADRYTYIPLIGINIALTWGLADLVRKRSFSAAALPLAASVALVICAATTLRQIGYWKDSESLFRHTLAVTKFNPVAETNYGCALVDKGSIDQAIIHFQRALELNPNYTEGHFNLGSALLEKKDFAAAIFHFQTGLAVRPDVAVAHYKLGLALMNTGNWTAAAAQFQETLARDPNILSAYNELGSVLRKLNRLDEAIAQYRAVLHQDPQYTDARNNLGVALAQSGLFSEAAAQFREALKQTPANALTHNNLGLAYENLGSLNEAVTQYREVLRLEPNNAPAQSNLDAVLKTQSGQR